MKLKQKAKDLSKQAALYCGSRHRQRRLYIQCELRTLVDLSKDVREKKNVAEQNPEVFKRMTDELQKIIDDGRTR